MPINVPAFQDFQLDECWNEDSCAIAGGIGHENIRFSHGRWISRLPDRHSQCLTTDSVMTLAMHYRRRAEEIRLFAKSQEGPAREKLIQLAEGYESAAKFHEQTILRARSTGVGD